MPEQHRLIREGSRWRTSSRRVERSEMIDFAKQWDPLAIHIDELGSRDSRFGDVIASGLFSIAVYQRLVADEVYAGQPIVAARALREVRFIRPLFAGEDVSAEVIVAASRQGRGDTFEVELHGSLSSEEAGDVLTVKVDLVVAMRM